MFSTLELYIFSASVLFCLALLRPVLYPSALRKLPGPTLARFSSFYRLLLVCSGNGPANIRKLHRKYGPIVRTGPNHVFVADPAMMSVIYPAVPTFPKAQFYEVFHLFYQGNTVETLVSTRSPAHHKRLRLSVASKFSPSSIRFLEPVLDDCIEIFTRSLYERHGQPVDLAEWLEYFAFDAASAMVLGTRLGFMEERKDINGTLAQLKGGFRYAAIVGQVPAWHPWLMGNKLLMSFLQKYTRFPNPMAEILRVVQERLNDWDEEKEASQNTIITWLQIEQKTSASKLSHADMVNNLFTYIAGSIAISTSLGAVFYYLLKNPVPYYRLVDEINLYESSTHITYPQTLGMPYLQAVLKEAMRLAPSVPLPLERCVPSDGATICGQFLPGGTNVSMCASVIHQNTTIYGDDVTSFRPERWLDAAPDARRAMEQHFFAFGRGSRACMGRDLAMMQMGKFVVELLRRFNFQWPKTTTAKENEWTVKSFWLPEQKGLYASLESKRT